MTNFTCNANGDAFIFWSPESVAANASVTSPLLIDNGATYNPVTGTTTAIAPIDMASFIGWANADVCGVSIVSAGMRVYFENASTTLQPKGRIYAMREAETNANNGMIMSTSSTYSSQQGAHTLSYVVNSKTHREFKNDNYSAIECVYQPRSRFSLEIGRPTAPLAQDPTGIRALDEHVLILTKFEATTQIYVELFYVYEVTVNPNGTYKSFGDYNTCVADPWPLIAQLGSNNDLWLRQVKLKDDHSHTFGQALKTVYNSNPETNVDVIRLKAFSAKP